MKPPCCMQKANGFLCDCKGKGEELSLLDQLSALTEERDKLKAELATAFERAAQVCDELAEEGVTNLFEYGTAIRQLKEGK